MDLVVIELVDAVDVLRIPSVCPDWVAVGRTWSKQNLGLAWSAKYDHLQEHMVVVSMVLYKLYLKLDMKGNGDWVRPLIVRAF